MRIAVISAWTSPESGGVGAYVARLVSLLESAGEHVLLIHGDAASVTGVRLVQARGLTSLATRANEPSATVLNALEDFSPNVVHLHDVNHVRLLHLISERYPVLRSVHNHSQHCPAGMRLIDSGKHICDLPFGVHCLKDLVLRRCHPSRNAKLLWSMYRTTAALNQFDRRLPCVCVASRYVRDELLANGFTEQQVYLLPYFAQPRPVSAVDVLDESTPACILFTGRIVPEKGLASLLHALAVLDCGLSWRLVVDGTGPAEGPARMLSRLLGLEGRVEFQGWCSPEAHARNYALADVVVVPSLWPEPFGLVGIEAMSYGKPVVAYAAGGIPDWLDHGTTGFLVDRGDEHKLGQALGALLTNRSLALQMGRRARERFQREYTPDNHLHRLMGAYELTVKRSRLGPGNMCVRP